MSGIGLAAKRVLITQSDAFMGPVLCEVFSDHGAVLEQWYRYETAAVEQALRDWCAENRIGIIENVETASTETAVEPRGGGTC